MSSKVAYPPSESRIQTAHVPSNGFSQRPRREAAIKSQAVTQAISGTKRRTGTATTSSSSTEKNAAESRKMAALPRAKRARRNEEPIISLPALAMNPTMAYGSGPSSSKSRGSIREMIGGQEREVFVVDSASPPPSSVATYSYGHDSLKGKRKAHEYGNELLADPTATAKRRRKNEVHPTEEVLYNSGTSVMGEYPVSYRGGYHAGNLYHKEAKNGTIPVPYAIPAPKEPIDDSEGHFIVREGDYVTDRYRITSLLGQGTFGKVVKCQDLTGAGEVAIKIIRAVQKYTDAAQIEIRVLRTLRDHDPANKYKCIHLLNTFTYRNHVCIVSELLGQSVFDFLKDNDFNPFPPLHIWHFARQLLRSVAFLHSLGLVHTDLKPENILLVNSKFSLVPITWRPNSRKKRVLQDCDIRLIDFGSATFNDEYHSQVVSTRHYRAPEIILQMGWSYPCDAWSIGCILIEFYTGEALFQTHDNLEHLAMMEAVLGPMPDDFRRKAETYRPTYFKSGRLDFPNPTTNRQSRKFVKAMKALDDTVVSQQGYAKHDKLFKNLLKKLLTFDPNQRIRVSDALKHPYFALESHEIPQ